MKTQRRLLHLSIVIGILLWWILFTPSDESFKCVVYESKEQPWTGTGSTALMIWRWL